MRNEQITLFADNAEYDSFVAKFGVKKTTDDCYTPVNVYEAVADWVAVEYGLRKDSFLRPFWPDGDYERHVYSDGCVVVDNPPFSILSRIVKFYNRRGVSFFLFCPALAPPKAEDVTIIATGCSIVYENGAEVNTSFVTNLQPELVLRTAPTLFEAVEAANRHNLRRLRRQLPKFEYPENVITAAMAQRIGFYGVEFSVARTDALSIRALDAQRAAGKSIFGSGWLLSEKAAAEKAAAEKAAAEKKNKTRWALSEREWAIVQWLGAKK